MDGFTIQTAGILTSFIWHVLARDQRVHITTLKGYDAEYPSVDHLSCFKGTFRNTDISLRQNYVIGYQGMAIGCNGGVFSMSGTLYGICVLRRFDSGSKRN
uniref:Uncharacterized protein n=1 Tax=Acrobeloides nanus TaxID=290746 RepID=A0A914DRQ7_9BILA